MTDNQICMECGSPDVHERVAEVKHRVGTRTVVVEAERHMYCPKCGTISYRGSQLDESQHAIAAQLRREDGLLTPDELRAVRLKYGFTQAEMEKMLTIGPKTWIRWERGKVVQSRTADQMIRQMAHNPDVVRSLMRAASVRNDAAERELDVMNKALEEKVIKKLREQVQDIPMELIELAVRTAAAELQAARSEETSTGGKRAA